MDTYDFYYSALTEMRLKKFNNGKVYKYLMVFINNKWLVYTECTRHGHTPSIQEGILKFLGTVDFYKNTKIL